MEPVGRFDQLEFVRGPGAALYGAVGLNASYRLTQQITAGVDAANLLDRDHYEAFVVVIFLGRRILGHLTYSW